MERRTTLTPQLKKAFLSLLDDPSPVVHKALVSWLEAEGAAGVAFLKTMVTGENRLLGIHASRMLGELKIVDPISEFRNFIRSLNYELETGALLMSRAVFPDLDVGKCCLLLHEISSRCLELILPAMSAREKCWIINRVLFDEYAFHGNTVEFSDPRNSFLSEVLDRRCGIPISLATVYILVAQRCGLNLEPVGIPGHFLVGCYLEKAPFYIDPFENGIFRTPEDIFSILRKNSVAPKLTYLAPTPIREVLCRTCRNLVNHYNIAQQPEMAQLFAEFVDEFEATYRRHANS